MRRDNIRIDILKTMAASFPIFMAFLYYLSRQYIEAYYQVYGIPSNLLSFAIEDYLYLGIQSGMVAIAVVFTILVVKLWKTFIIHRSRKFFYKESRLSKLKSKKQANSKSNKRRIIRYLDTLERFRRRTEIFMPIGYLICTAIMLLVVLLIIRPLEPMLAKYFAEIITIAFAIACALSVFTERKIVRFLLLKRRLYESIAVLTILVVVIFVQLLPHSIGAVKGMYDQSVGRASQVFDVVTVRTDRPFGGDDLEWQITERGSYQNAEPLLLVHSSETSLFLIPADKTDVTFCVDKQDILSMSLHTGQ